MKKSLITSAVALAGVVAVAAPAFADGWQSVSLSTSGGTFSGQVYTDSGSNEFRVTGNVDDSTSNSDCTYVSVKGESGIPGLPQGGLRRQLGPHRHRSGEQPRRQRRRDQGLPQPQQLAGRLHDEVVLLHLIQRDRSDIRPTRARGVRTSGRPSSVSGAQTAQAFGPISSSRRATASRLNGHDPGA